MKITGQNKLPLPIETVFDEGTKSEHWRRRIFGIKINPEDEVVALQGLVRLSFSYPNLPISLPTPELDCRARVIKCIPNQLVELQGEDPNIGPMGLSFSMTETPDGMTIARHEFEGDFRRLGRCTKLAAETLLKPPLSLAIRGFANQMKDSIVEARRPEVITVEV
jgi:hypothetical protein